MTAFTLPVTTAPGAHVHESGGRLINCFAEKLTGSAGAMTVIRAVPGLLGFATSSNTGFRGMKQVGSLLYSVWGSSSGKVYKVDDEGGALEALTGNIGGTARVFLAANNAGTPDVVAVAPGDGAFSISTTAVSAFADTDVGSPNAVCFHKSFFIFTYGDGKLRSSGVNAVTINTLDVTTAEYKRDTLYRPMSHKGTLLAMGSESIEFYGGQNDTGFPFSFVTAADIGILGPYAATGDHDGWDSGVFFAASDFTVRQLVGYGSEIVSSPDLDRLIAEVSDKTTIHVDSYMSNGRPIVVVQCDDWTWEYCVTSKTWNERQSYDDVRWRGMGPAKAFDKWLCGDTESGNILQILASERDEADSTLRARVETGPIGDFPYAMRVDRAEMYVTKGVGIATGSDPDQTDPSIGIAFSGDGGQTWKTPRVVKLGRQAITGKRVATNRLGHAIGQGARLRFDVSDAVPFGMMAGDLKVTRLK